MSYSSFDWEGVDPGMFTANERELLKRYGSFYRDVMRRIIPIDSEEQEHFVLVCETALKTYASEKPRTAHERV